MNSLLQSNNLTFDNGNFLGDIRIDSNLNLSLTGSQTLKLKTPLCTLETPKIAPTPGQLLKTDIKGKLSWFDNPNKKYRDLQVASWEPGNLTQNTNAWEDVCWSPELGIFCAVASLGTLRVATSQDGVTWTLRSASDNTLDWTGICWSPELGLFCAVSGNGTSTGNDTVMTSDDGINWTTQLSSFSAPKKVCWSPELGIFCAIGEGSGPVNKVITSTDGITWTPQTLSQTGRTIVWSPQLGIFCGLDQNNSVTSPDGINWTIHPNFSGNLGLLTWSPQLGIFCVSTGLGSIYTSTDGANWTNTATIPQMNTFVQMVEWSPELELFCVVGGTCNPADNNYYTCATSPDAVTWTLRNMPEDNIPSPNGKWRSICWSPDLGIFCTVSGSFEPGISRSAISYR